MLPTMEIHGVSLRYGAPGAIPTRDLPLRRRTLYAAELREHKRKPRTKVTVNERFGLILHHFTPAECRFIVVVAIPPFDSLMRREIVLSLHLPR